MWWVYVVSGSPCEELGFTADQEAFLISKQNDALW